ncbi:hypothetical protein R6Y95_06120 [Methanoculleus palmolei]|uniref:Uncharacterized protein n=1 Tax=Methanoculleus palmolei TaxID=72612 RepID=A0ABD8A7P3_9EURY|nr:hypothetical protein R6Y95_06120 [Methanoculleus palmolei]
MNPCPVLKRLIEDENNYGRALALLEDRVRDLEEVGESVAERLCRLEKDELDAIDERLCRLEAAVLPPEYRAEVGR